MSGRGAVKKAVLQPAVVDQNLNAFSDGLWWWMWRDLMQPLEHAVHWCERILRPGQSCRPDHLRGWDHE